MELEWVQLKLVRKSTQLSRFESMVEYLNIIQINNINRMRVFFFFTNENVWNNGRTLNNDFRLYYAHACIMAICSAPS